MKLEDVVTDSSSNRHIIYKFMKKGFNSLTAEDLACTVVNPSFSADFKKNAQENWMTNYHPKVIEKL